MSTHYVFDTEQQAIDAEAFISSAAGYPWAKTDKWAVPYQRINDNKWVFPIVPLQRILQIMTVEQAIALVTQFDTDHPHAEEEAQDNWYPDAV